MDNLVCVRDLAGRITETAQANLRELVGRMPGVVLADTDSPWRLKSHEEVMADCRAVIDASMSEPCAPFVIAPWPVLPFRMTTRDRRRMRRKDRIDADAYDFFEQPEKAAKLRKRARNG